MVVLVLYCKNEKGKNTMTYPFRYRRLSYVALNVTNLQKSSEFYEKIVGLTLSDSTDEYAYFRCDRNHHNVVLCASKERGVKRVGFEIETDAELEIAFEHFKALGYAPAWISDEEAKTLKQGRTFRVREKNTGLQIELFSKVTFMSNAFVPTVAKIERVGHVVIGSPHYEEAYKTLTNDFGFATSDYIENMIYFMRCYPNPLHHTFAIGPAKVNQLHHVNFMVTDIDDIGEAIYRMKENNVPVVFGPGRHPPSDSIFFYFQDPDGMTLEYSFGMELFPEGDEREPRMMEATLKSLDTWGTKPHPDFGVSGAIEV